MLQNDLCSRIRPFFYGGGGGKLSLLLALLCLALALAGCDHESPDEGGVLTGNWKYSFEYGGIDYVTEIKITGSTVEFTDSFCSYKANIVNSPNFEESYGVLITEFTEYSGEPNYNGKFGAMYWKGLSSNSVYLAEVWSSGGSIPTRTTSDDLNAAKTAFPKDGGSAIIDWSILSPYSK
jgi:hypothetical protein